MLKYLAIAAVISLCLLGYLLLDETEKSSEEKNQVVIAVAKTPLSAPFYVADELRLFPEYCNNLKMVDVVGGNLSFNYLIDKKADYATSSDSVIVYQGSMRQDFSTLGSFVQSDNDIKLISQTEEVFDSNNLDDKARIGIVSGSASEYFLSLYLAFAGISPNKVHITHMPADKLPEALSKNRLDAIAIWEPFAFNAINLLNGTGKVQKGEGLYTLTFNLLIRTADIRRNHKTSVCLLKGLQEAINIINQNPEEAKEIVKQKLKLNNDFIDWIWQDYVFKLSLGQSLLLNLESQARWRKVDKSIQTSLADLVEPSAMLDVSPSSVSIRLKAQR